MSFGRFVWLLQFRQLWLARIDRVGDPWELALTKEQRQQLLAGLPTLNERLIALYNAETTVQFWRMFTYVNCWCADEHESYALWRVYCPTPEGIAIETTLGRLKQSVRNLPVYAVRYTPPPPQPSFQPTHTPLATQKRPMFAYEKEVRVLSTNMKVATDGYGIPWFPEAHLQKILVHPAADDAFVDTVKATVDKWVPSLKDRVHRSRMADPPST
jgi:hypothetical protein